MKNALKIIGSILLCLGVIAFVVCEIAIPNETNNFLNEIGIFLNKPFMLCGVSVTIGGVFVFIVTRYILSNTSVGKKRLNELNDKIVSIGKATKEEYEETQKTIADYQSDNNDKFNDIDKALNKVNDAILLIPNKKVQEALKNGEEEPND